MQTEGHSILKESTYTLQKSQSQEIRKAEGLFQIKGN